jgi:hypothetical protein
MSFAQQPAHPVGPPPTGVAKVEGACNASTILPFVSQTLMSTNRSYAGTNLGGVPVEHMVLLANMVRETMFMFTEGSMCLHEAMFQGQHGHKLQQHLHQLLWFAKCGHCGLPVLKTMSCYCDIRVLLMRCAELALGPGDWNQTF